MTTKPKRDSSDYWMDWAWRLVTFGFLPMRFEEGRPPLTRLLLFNVTILWFLVTLPIQLLLLFPSLGCYYLAISSDDY